MTTDPWSGRKVLVARGIVSTWLPAPCGRCGKTVRSTDQWVVGHKIARSIRPDLVFEVSNWQPEHRKCSDASAQQAVQQKAFAAGVKAAQTGVFSQTPTPRKSPPLSAHTLSAPASPMTVRAGLTWAELCQSAPSWLKPYLDVPDNAAPPMWVSGVHPEAVGSYGPAAIEWMETNLIERGRPLRFRWWQKLAIVRQLEHRADGSLCWRVILESGPRRIGKSVRLRAMALWRLAVGSTLFEPEQLIVHTGKDLAIVREVFRKAYPFAEVTDGWGCKKGMTEPEVSYLTTNRWVVRSKDATTGYDCCLALVDESWDVPPTSIDDDLEPSMLERVSPQLLLTSTAHRRATSLMRGRLIDALAADDGETLVLLWGAPVDSEPGDPATWKAASAHWSDERRALIAAKYDKALAGESDPEFDDPDPMAGFTSQYLNIWRLKERKHTKGTALIEPDVWNALICEEITTPPNAAAIESWFEQGYSLALAWQRDGRAHLKVTDHPDLTSVVQAIRRSGFRGLVTVGASLMDDPELKTLRKRKGEGRVISAVQELQRLLTEDAIRHDGTEHLTQQVLAIRTLPGADGPRMASSNRADGVKAAVWVSNTVRANIGNGKTRIILPSNIAG